MLDLQAYFFNYYAIPNLIVSSVIFVVGLFVFIQNPKNTSNIFFFLFCLSLNFWLYGRAIMYCSKDPQTAFVWAKVFAKFGVVNIAPLVYAFSVHWLHLYERQKKYVIGGFVTAGVLYFSILLTPYGLLGVRKYFWGYYPIYGPIAKLFLVFFFSYFLAAFYNFFSEWKKTAEPARRKQIRLVTIAYLISFTGSVDFIPKVINFSFYPWGYLSVFVWTMVLAYSIVRYRVMDIQTVVHKTLMWLLSMTVAVLPFAFLVTIAYPWIVSLDPVSLSFIFVGLCAAFYFYFRLIQPRLDRVFQRRSSNLNLVLNKFSGELVHLKSLRDILQGVTRTIRKNLYTREVSIYLKDDSDTQLVPLIAKRVRGLKPIALGHPFLKWLEIKDQVVLTDLIRSDPEVQDFQQKLTEYIEVSDAKVLVPLVLGGKLIGAIHLGNKDGMRRYTSEEIVFLSRLKSPVTIAFSNSLHVMAMQENLQKWNEELEKKVDERTRQLQDTQAQLIQAEKLATIGTLAGGVAHEINNPLTAVLTNAQILKMNAIPSDVESISLIEEGAKRCQIIIQKLMNYSRKPIQKEATVNVDLGLVVESTIGLLRYQLEQDNILVNIKNDLDLKMLEGNFNELEQVLTNLILNAKDAIRGTSKEGLISISTYEESGTICLSVKDNGSGISKENLTKIFDPFFTTKDIGKGTGLGLAVTFGIIQKHGGIIDVSSEIGKGSTFIIKFPYSPSEKNGK